MVQLAVVPWLVPPKSDSGLIPAVLIHWNPWHPTKIDAEVILSPW
jgi:hypothetical protein